MVQWLRTHLPVQGTPVWSLIWEDSTCHGATKPTATESTCLESVLLLKRSHSNEMPAYHNQRKPYLQQRWPSAAKNKIFWKLSAEYLASPLTYWVTLEMILTYANIWQPLLYTDRVGVRKPPKTGSTLATVSLNNISRKSASQEFRKMSCPSPQRCFWLWDPQGF